MASVFVLGALGLVLLIIVLVARSSENPSDRSAVFLDRPSARRLGLSIFQLAIAGAIVSAALTSVILAVAVGATAVFAVTLWLWGLPVDGNSTRTVQRPVDG